MEHTWDFKTHWYNSPINTWTMLISIFIWQPNCERWLLFVNIIPIEVSRLIRVRKTKIGQKIIRVLGIFSLLGLIDSFVSVLAGHILHTFSCGGKFDSCQLNFPNDWMDWNGLNDFGMIGTCVKHLRESNFFISFLLPIFRSTARGSLKSLYVLSEMKVRRPC